MLSVKRSRPYSPQGVFLFSLFLLLAFAIVYREYRFYRLPILEQIPKTLEDQRVISGVTRNGIPSIDEPVFETISTADQHLQDDGFGIAVHMNGFYRFYPYQILVWHEIVNDVFEGKPLAITYSPLTYTSAVFERDLGEEVGVLTFGVDGTVLDNHLVLYDRQTESLWSQLHQKSFAGKLHETVLSSYPFTVMNWQTFKTIYPNGQALSQETGVSRDYLRNPYGNYHLTQDIYFPLSHMDERLPSKTVIFGITVGDKHIAIPKEIIIKEKDFFLDLEEQVTIHIVYDASLDFIQAFLKKGEREEALQLEPAFWFSWVATHPQTEIYQGVISS